MQLGKPHAPLVAEDDPDITISRLALERNAIAAYGAFPKRANSSTPLKSCATP